jgi:hypothetical protein
MSTDRDTTRIVRSWLEEGVTALPDRVLDTVLDQVPATPQRRPWWPARRSTPMSVYLKLAAAAAAAVILIFVVGRTFLPGGNVGGPASAPPTSTPAPTASPAPLDGQVNLDGRYVVGAGLAARVTVAVPAGWKAGGDWVVIGPKSYEPPAGMAIRFFKADFLYQNPLDESDGTISVGPTAEDLAAALANHPGWEATAATDVTIDSLVGKHVEVTIPLDTVFGADGKFLLFGDLSGGQVWGFVPGQVHEISIVDIDGERVVIEAYHYPGTSADDIAAQQAVLDSIELDPAGS